LGRTTYYVFIFHSSWTSCPNLSPGHKHLVHLLLNFNEIDAYGPVLGTLVPCCAATADRTAEQILR
jgi:hypothetical protein